MIFRLDIVCLSAANPYRFSSQTEGNSTPIQRLKKAPAVPKDRGGLVVVSGEFACHRG